MIQVFADDTLVYDSRLEDYCLKELAASTGTNVGGTASITMPVNHPAYNSFVSYKTLVRIYRDGALRFRGRALYPADTSMGERVITCEGELCFFRDSISRPYLFESTPAKIFRALVRAHNEQVDTFKTFEIGEVTVVDDNDYIRLESESAETTLDTFNKLLERCGGYIVFTGEANARTINWYATLDHTSSQVVELGENLLDFTRTGANTATLATGLVPYGAWDEETKKRVTIESVNDGKDYILAADGVETRGIIMATAVWDDVTVPENLLKKARALLEERKMFITSLTLTALDLSYIDKSLDSFTVGDQIRVVSKPHGIDDYMELTAMTENFLYPSQSSITLGKDIASLTGADVADDFRGMSEMEAIKVKYGIDIQKVATDVEGNVMSQVSTGYASKGEVADMGTSVLGQVSEGYATKQDAADLQTAINNEVNARAGVINKVSGVVNISGGAPIKMLGGKVDITGSEVNIGDTSHPTRIYGGNVALYGDTYFEGGNAIFANNAGLRMKDKDGNVYFTLRIDSSNNCFVGNDYSNLYLRGPAVYLHNSGAVVTSDARMKNSIEELPDAYMAMLDRLTPVRFKYNDGTSGRYHVGFVAQEVEEALTAAGLSSADFGGFVDLNGDGATLGLAYDEFVGLLFQKIRKLESRIEALEEKV